MSSDTIKKYGLIGKKLSHSFSKNFFENKYKCDQSITYDNLEFVSVKDLKQKFSSLKEYYHGLNVTIPYKESILPLLDEIDDNALKINAVNCIKLHNNTTIGYNTDYTGFTESIKTYITGFHKKAVILGSGGASKAVKYALEKNYDIETQVISRNDDKLNYQYLEDKGLNSFQLIINTTPLGMHPYTKDFPLIPYHTIQKGTLVIDLIYNPFKTLFLKKCHQNGAVTMNGMRMLILQARHSFEIWNQCE